MRKIFLALLLTTTFAAPPPARAEAPAPLGVKAKAKISMEEARTTALRRVPGKVQKEELEREGDKLIYSFDVLEEGGRLMEIHVDALTGEVLRVEEEAPARKPKGKERK